ncbi:hypothetical protein JHK86_033445 [Glycine max]|nr:hypothetical protein JHK86_033445 [Glycine max]
MVSVLDQSLIYMLHAFTYQNVQLGWDSISGEDHSISLLRREVFQALATFDHDKTQQEALRRFQILLDGRNTSLPPANIRRIPDQDIIYVLAGISNEGSETAWRWLKVCASMVTSS